MEIKSSNNLLIKKGEQNFIVNKGETVRLFVDDLIDDSIVNFSLKEGSKLLISIIADHEVNNFVFNAKLEKNAEIEIYFAEFSTDIINLNATINLNEEGAKAYWHLASLASQHDKKNINVSILHNAPLTLGKVDNYGVVKEEAKLLFSGISHIINGAVKSKTQQNAKIMVFDEHSDAIAKPILKIDENDIEASHAAAVGKISDEHLFYLTSRGISLDEARTLITLGYLKPIFKGFDEERVEYLNKLIGGRL